MTSRWTISCTRCGTPIESFYSAPNVDGGAGHYCSPACVAEAVKKWAGFSCHVCSFKPERASRGLHHVAKVSEFRRLLQPFEDHQRFVIYLDRDLGDSGSVWVHITGDRAWVTHMTMPGGVNTYCRNNDINRDEQIGFWLSNGQEDLIHWNWTVKRKESLRALEYFLMHADRDPALSWAVPRNSFSEPEPA